MTRQRVTGSPVCPECGGPKNPRANRCHACQKYRCAVCGAYDPHPLGGKCQVCATALAHREEVNRASRPQGFAFPAGHLEALAARAAAGLPLFPERRSTCPTS